MYNWMYAFASETFIASVISGLIASIIISGALWVYIHIRNKKISHFNYLMLATNVYAASIITKASITIEEEIHHYIKLTKEKINTIRFTQNLMLDEVLLDIVKYSTVVIRKVVFMEKIVGRCLELLNNIDVSLLKPQIRYRLIDRLTATVRVRRFQINPTFETQILSETDVAIRYYVRDRNILRNETARAETEIEKLGKSNDEGKESKILHIKNKINGLINEIKKRDKEQIESVVKIVETVLKDIIIDLATRRRALDDNETAIKEITQLLPNRIKKEIIKDLPKDIKELKEVYTLLSEDPELRERIKVLQIDETLEKMCDWIRNS